MTSTSKILGKLKEARENSHLSQNFIASKLGINRTTFARKEQGDIPITTDEWVTLSSILEKDLSAFFDSTNSGETKENFKRPTDEEKSLLTLYRSLNINEKTDFISTIRLLLKRVTRKKVQKTLEEFSK